MTIFSKWLTMEEQERDCNLTSKRQTRVSSCTNFLLTKLCRMLRFETSLAEGFET